jgi:ABC-type antimicrobial peptide transport system permease subunit
MLMAVFERIREFGVLKAIGVGPGAVMAIIMLETWVMTTVAIGVGLALSVPTLWYLSVYGIDLSSAAGVSIQGVAFDPHWRAVVSADAYIGPLIALCFMATAAALYPAWRAARIQPVEAMRHR